MPLPDINIVVDIHSEPMTRRLLRDGTTIGLDPGLEKPYRRSVADAVGFLEGKGVPTIWVRFVPPPRQAMQTPEQTAEALRIDKATGMNRDSIIVYKTSLDAFGDGKTRDGRSLHTVLQRLEARRLSLMGGNADVCVLATALGAVRHGYGVTILSDLLVGRDNPSRKASIDESNILQTMTNILENPDMLKAHNHPLKGDYAGPISMRDQHRIRYNLRVAQSDAFFAEKNIIPIVSPPSDICAPARPVTRLVTKGMAPGLSLVYVASSVDGAISCPTQSRPPPRLRLVQPS